MAKTDKGSDLVVVLVLLFSSPFFREAFLHIVMGLHSALLHKKNIFQEGDV